MIKLHSFINKIRDIKAVGKLVRIQRCAATVKRLLSQKAGLNTSSEFLLVARGQSRIRDDLLMRNG